MDPVEAWVWGAFFIFAILLIGFLAGLLTGRAL